MHRLDPILSLHLIGQCTVTVVLALLMNTPFLNMQVRPWKDYTLRKVLHKDMNTKTDYWDHLRTSQTRTILQLCKKDFETTHLRCKMLHNLQKSNSKCNSQTKAIVKNNCSLLSAMFNCGVCTWRPTT